MKRIEFDQDCEHCGKPDYLLVDEVDDYEIHGACCKQSQRDAETWVRNQSAWWPALGG